MGKSADELRLEIAQTRDELGQTFNAIEDRVSPKRVLHRGTERIRSAMTSGASVIAGAAHAAPGAIKRRARGKPLTAGLILFGACAVIAALVPSSKKE